MSLKLSPPNVRITGVIVILLIVIIVILVNDMRHRERSVGEKLDSAVEELRN